MRYLNTRRGAAIGVAVALVLGAAGCDRGTHNEPRPSPSQSVNISLDPALIGDRSSNPSCTRPIGNDQQWRQILDDRLFSGLPLGPGASVRAQRHGGKWKLMITPRDGTPSTHRVAFDVVSESFYLSCLRRVYRLFKPVTVYDGDIGRRADPVPFGARKELVVTFASIVDGKVMWTVDSGNGAYDVLAEDLEQAGTSSDDVPVGLWRDDPDSEFFQIQKPLRTRAGNTLPAGTRISIDAIASCGVTRSADVMGFKLYPDGELNGRAEAPRAALLVALPGLDGTTNRENREWLAGVNVGAACPVE